ncbi:ATP-binding protein [Paenibacillus sp. MBLB4367]|uniref:ATP-binding protein n=1 Tax=Paenibacillus sp. MBLB4367 TaxID=3384767 RepID=UPI0039082BE9
MKKKIGFVIMMAVTVSLLGEFKFYPFYNDFRVSLGTPAFLFFLLWNRKLPTLALGIITALSVTSFRIAEDVAVNGMIHRFEAFDLHYPAFFYYLTYSVLFYCLRIQRFRQRPFVLGLLAVVTEIAANAAELLFRYPNARDEISVIASNEIVLIAIFRSFCVVGLFILINHRERQIAERQQRKQFEQMLLVISHLYEEAIQLKKTQQDAERITRDSYELYQLLKDEKTLPNGEALARSALQIAGQVHEIKKDNQRIYAGISNIISSESSADMMPLPELCEVALKTNRNYARMLGRTIDFRLEVSGDHPLYPIYTVLSLLNNLLANAVESIAAAGIITLSASLDGEWLVLEVRDNGPGISPKVREAVFEPGFTTKFDASGNPSTGIGLYYVRELAGSLQGEVNFQSRHTGETGTTFTLRLPIHNLIHKRVT